MQGFYKALWFIYLYGSFPSFHKHQYEQYFRTCQKNIQTQNGMFVFGGGYLFICDSFDKNLHCADIKTEA